MKLNDTLHGFTVTRITELREIDTVQYELTHDKTGLELVWLSRDDENKTFGIAFTTLPQDDTGIFHILEHSVLCGSKRYPVKEPFVELLKNSMNTFLNAMTFADKTVYPVSSRNDKDFKNLVRVYLDAVFCPAIYDKPEIFRQEGWHYELDENGEATYKGVVFNEMKGAFADADELMDNEISRALFPDNAYRFVSGGDPAHIPDLTYEAFLEGHRTYYSPSNARVFLDGDLNLEELLAILDEEYLSRFERTERIAPPAQQEPVDGGVRQVTYELAPDEDPEGRTRLGMARVIGSFRENEKLVAMAALAEVLCGSNQAPVTRAVLEQGLAENVTLSVRDGIAQSWCCLEARNLKAEDLDRVRDLIFATLREQADNGLDYSQLEAVLANQEFRMRERDYGSYPLGLIYGFTMLESWLYGGKPEVMLQPGTLFDDLRSKMHEGYFENLIREVLLENPHGCQVILTPSHTLGEERQQLEADRLKAETDAWTDARREEIALQQEALLDWQSSEDTPEQLATLPHLGLEDIPVEPVELPLEVEESAGMKLLLHPAATNGIAYITLFFDADSCSREELSALAFLCALLGETRTSRHSAEDLIRMDRLLCGSLRYSIGVFGVEDTCKRKFCVTLSALESKLEEALALALEVITDTTLDEEAAALELLKQGRQHLMEQIIMSGSGIAMSRVLAQYYSTGVAGEHVSGYALYQWYKNQENNWDWAALSAQLRELLRRLVRREGLAVSITGDAHGLKERVVKQLLEGIKADPVQLTKAEIVPWGKRREGIMIPADIAFAVQGGDYRAAGGSYNGVMPVATKIISFSYLWNMIRVQGGAYGAGFSARPSGLLSCYSYRDPNAAGSLGVFPTCGGFLKEFAAEDPDLTGFIIGAVSDASPLLTPRQKGQSADSMYWQELTWERRCARRRQMLEATPQQLQELGELYEKTLENGGVCVVGGRQQLEACELDEILPL